MDSLLAEFGHPTYVPFSVIAFRLILAALLGGAIGFERETQNRPAGLRTHILICVATAMIAILTIELAHAEMFQVEAAHFDPIRAIEAATAGIAFLAAGTILFARGEVHGLTTGAGMWLAGAIGLCAGLGFWTVALFGTALALAVLYLVGRMETKLEISDQDKAPKPEKPDAERP